MHVVLGRHANVVGCQWSWESLSAASTCTGSTRIGVQGSWYLILPYLHAMSIATMRETRHDATSSTHIVATIQGRSIAIAFVTIVGMVLWCRCRCGIVIVGSRSVRGLVVLFGFSRIVGSCVVILLMSFTTIPSKSPTTSSTHVVGTITGGNIITHGASGSHCGGFVVIIFIVRTGCRVIRLLLLGCSSMSFAISSSGLETASSTHLVATIYGRTIVTVRTLGWFIGRLIFIGEFRGIFSVFVG